MLPYALRRLAQTIPVLLGVLVLAFVLMRLVPGGAVEGQLDQRATADARAAIERRLGLDRPWWLQLAGYATLDFGMSQRQDRPARDIVLASFANTMKLALAAMLLAATAGMALGVAAARARGRWIDRVAMALAMLGVSTPVFWLGMLLLAVARRLGWPYLTDDGSGHLAYIVLPALALAANSAALIARMSRAALVETLDQDYLRTARAKGVPESAVVLRHGLANAMIPIATVIGLDFASYLAGAVLTETVFQYRGLGLVLVEAIQDRNQPVILCGVALITFTFVAANLAVDLLCAYLDPRSRDAIGA